MQPNCFLPGKSTKLRHFLMVKSLQAKQHETNQKTHTNQLISEILCSLFTSCVMIIYLFNSFNQTQTKLKTWNHIQKLHLYDFLFNLQLWIVKLRLVVRFFWEFLSKDCTSREKYRVFVGACDEMFHFFLKRF